MKTSSFLTLTLLCLGAIAASARPPGPGTPATIRPFETAINALAFGDGKYVAVGQEGAVYSSADLKSWMFQRLDTSADLVRVAYGQGTFVAAGLLRPAPYEQTRIFVSNDGLHWSPTATLDGQVYSLTFGAGRFVTTGSWSRIFASTDGRDWVKATVDVSDNIYACAFGRGRFVAVGGHVKRRTVITSTDGLSWKQVNIDYSPLDETLDVPAIVGVTYGNGQFLFFTGQPPEISVFTSQDGLGWTGKRLALPQWPSGVVYGNGRYVGINKGTEALSADGNAWDGTDLTGANAVYLTFINGKFITTGGPNTLLLSTEGLKWDTVAVTANGNPHLAPDNFQVKNGAVTLQVSGLSGQQVVVERSNDLDNWKALQTVVVPDSGVVTVKDPAAAGGHAYYRAGLLLSQ